MLLYGLINNWTILKHSTPKTTFNVISL